MKFTYICSECKTVYAVDPDLMVCPDCSNRQETGQPLRGILEVDLKPDPGDTVDAEFHVRDLLPVEQSFFPPIPVGNTPLWKPERLRRELGFTSLYIKDDGANPTNSFKDRASFLVSAFAKKYGINDISLASTGNAGSSMAGVAAAAGQKVTLFLPKDAPDTKLIQALQYDAVVHRVNGNYDLAYDLSMAFSEKTGCMNRNTAYNPMTIEGKKTVSLELFQQLGRAPDMVILATGDGCILSGVYKGFGDLKKMGMISRIPIIYSVQAETSDALYRAFHAESFENTPTHTIADSICVDVPRNGVHALSQLKQYGGRMVRVSDERIIASQARLSRSAGLFAEPAGAAAFAGFLKIRKNLPKDAVIVILSTGNGLKDSRTASHGVCVPKAVINTIEDIT